MVREMPVEWPRLLLPRSAKAEPTETQLAQRVADIRETRAQEEANS